MYKDLAYESFVSRESESWNSAGLTGTDVFSNALLVPRDWSLRLMARTYRSFIWGLASLPPAFIAWDSRTRARRAFLRAAQQVPAYAQFLAQRATPADPIPEMDKENYIKAFPIEERCVGGRIPFDRVTIDESSGSTGTPFNWVRSEEERHHAHQLISYFSNYCFGTGPRITINAFSMGAWATGMNMGLAMERNSIVKNTGTDIGKILHTLRVFGPRHDYLILGYPPFLKHLSDVAAAEGFPLHEYRMDALVGGEGMSEGLRDYLLRRFRKVFSGYGATRPRTAVRVPQRIRGMKMFSHHQALTEKVSRRVFVQRVPYLEFFMDIAQVTSGHPAGLAAFFFSIIAAECFCR